MPLQQLLLYKDEIQRLMAGERIRIMTVGGQELILGYAEKAGNEIHTNGKTQPHAKRGVISNAILEYLKNNPGSTVNQITHGVGRVNSMSVWRNLCHMIVDKEVTRNRDNQTHTFTAVK